MENANNNGNGKLAIYVIAGLGTFLLMAFLVNQMVSVTQPAPVAAERATARATDNAAIRGAGAEALKSWGYVDQPRGIVRLPILLPFAVDRGATGLVRGTFLVLRAGLFAQLFDAGLKYVLKA